MVRPTSRFVAIKPETLRNPSHDVPADDEASRAATGGEPGGVPEDAPDLATGAAPPPPLLLPVPLLALVLGLLFFAASLVAGDSGDMGNPLAAP